MVRVTEDDFVQLGDGRPAFNKPMLEAAMLEVAGVLERHSAGLPGSIKGDFAALVCLLARQTFAPGSVVEVKRDGGENQDRAE